MNRKQMRASRANGRSLQKKPWNKFVECTAEANAKHKLLNPDSEYFPDVVYANNKYVVQVFFDRTVLGKHAKKAMIRRCDGEPIYSWTDMQRIKNEIFGEEVEAIQLFPKESELVDDAHIYWMWVLE